MKSLLGLNIQLVSSNLLSSSKPDF